jgi:hypothetical protein
MRMTIIAGALFGLLLATTVHAQDETCLNPTPEQIARLQATVDKYNQVRQRDFTVKQWVKEVLNRAVKSEDQHYDSWLEDQGPPPTLEPDTF